MDDHRVAWMKERTYAALGLRDNSLFEGLLDREDGKLVSELVTSMDTPMDGKYSPAVIFYPLEHEVEEMVEELEGELAS